METKEIIKKVKSYFKKDINILELSLVNYETVNYYIRLDKDKKNNIYYLRSIDFNIIKEFNKKHINQEIILEQPVNVILDILSKATIRDLNVAQANVKANLVQFEAVLDDNRYNYQFNMFIPKNIPYLADILFIMFSNLPKRLSVIFDQLVAVLENKEIKYLYKKPFKFNLLKDDYKKLFNKETIELGEKQYNSQNVRFLELINDTYYASVEDLEKKELLTVLVVYNKKEHITKVSCTCSKECYCEHMYAVMEAIRNNDFFKYYKVRYINNQQNMFDKLFTLNYYLCLGIDHDRLAIVLPDGLLDAVPVLNEDGISMFEVVEDDDEKNLTRIIKELENKKN